jgi:hypothetical protein
VIREHRGSPVRIARLAVRGLPCFGTSEEFMADLLRYCTAAGDLLGIVLELPTAHCRTSPVTLKGVLPMATYRMVYGDDEQVVRETFENIDDVQREDGWIVLFRGREAILRLQEIHVQSMERLDP